MLKSVQGMILFTEHEKLFLHNSFNIMSLLNELYYFIFFIRWYIGYSRPTSTPATSASSPVPAAPMYYLIPVDRFGVNLRNVGPLTDTGNDHKGMHRAYIIIYDQLPTKYSTLLSIFLTLILLSFWYGYFYELFSII